MKKKILLGGCIGCLLVVLLTGAILAGLAFWGVSKLQGIGKSFEAAATSVNTLRSDFPFAAKTVDEPLDAARYQSYLDARAALDGVIAKYPNLNTVFTALRAGQTPDIGAMQIFALVGEIPKALEDAAKAMRDESMSFDEFSYYSRLTLTTIKGAAEEGDARYSGVWDKISTAATELDAAMAKNQNDPNAPKLEVTPLLEALDASELPEETKITIRERLDSLEDDPTMLVIETLIILLTNQI